MSALPHDGLPMHLSSHPLDTHLISICACSRNASNATRAVAAHAQEVSGVLWTRVGALRSVCAIRDYPSAYPTQ